MCTAQAQPNTHSASITCPSLGTFSLCRELSPNISACAGSRLLVSVASNTHYLYDALRPHLPPAARYTGHEASSFYIKAAFSPDGSHFVSGSSDKNAYIWAVRHPSLPRSLESTRLDHVHTLGCRVSEICILAVRRLAPVAEYA